MKTLFSCFIFSIVPLFIITSCGGDGGGDPILPDSTANVYVTNLGDASITEIESSDNSTVGPFSVGTAPGHVVVYAAGRKAFVGDLSASTVHVVDIQTNSVESPISLTGPVGGLDIDNINGRVYALDTYDGSPGTEIHVIDASTATKITEVTIGTNLQDIRVVPSWNKAYISDFTEGIIIFDTSTNTKVGTIPLGDGPHGMVVDTTNDILYVTQVDGDSVTLINTDTNAVITTISVGTTPQWIVLNSAKTKAFVTNEGDGTVSVIDTATRTAGTPIPVGTSPFYIIIDDATNRAYVSNSGSDNVTIFDINTETEIDTVPVGDQPIGLAHFL